MRDEIVTDLEKWSSRSGISLTNSLALVGIRKARFYDWKKRFGKSNKHNGMAPKNSWILPSERQAIINFFSKNPLNGCRRLSYMMLDQDIACVSGNTVHRVLRSEGLINLSTNSPSKKGSGFDQPSKPHSQWHIDISYINAGGTFYYLCSILDGFSRFICHWEIAESMKVEAIELIVQRALEKFEGNTPRMISDNGPQFKAREFKTFIKLCGMDQTFTSPYYPQSNGKIERWHKELKQTCIRPSQPRNLEEARASIASFIEDYNYQRLHSAIGYVTPYDKLLGLDTDLKVERIRKLTAAKEKRKCEWEKIRQSACEKLVALTG